MLLHFEEVFFRIFRRLFQRLSNLRSLLFAFSVKKEEALKRSLEEKNSQIYIERSKVIHRILWLAPLTL